MTTEKVTTMETPMRVTDLTFLTLLSFNHDVFRFVLFYHVEVEPIVSMGLWKNGLLKSTCPS